jgi:hypothetical protein
MALAKLNGSFSAAGPGPTFTPRGGRRFNVSIWGGFAGTVQLERSPDGGASWIPAAAARTAPDTFNCEEPEDDVAYRLTCTALSSGAISWRVAQ